MRVRNSPPLLASRAAQLLGILDEIAARLPEVQSRIRAKLQERIAAEGALGRQRNIRCGIGRR